tara:strand:+ start:1808 stop:2059 length:252 start_codon:yes stop_codon:yes gene_type:complete
MILIKYKRIYVFINKIIKYFLFLYYYFRQMKIKNDKYERKIKELNILNNMIMKKNIRLRKKLKKKEKLINDIYKKTNDLNAFI